MKLHPLRRAAAWLLILPALCLLTACDRGMDPADTSAPAEEVTSTVGDVTETPENSENATELPTEAPTEATSEDETQPPEVDDGSIRFAVLSDVHIGKVNLPINPADKFAAALDGIHRVLGSPHAILVAGDLTDLGTNAQYQEFNTVLWDHIPGDTVVCTVMGNHEYFRDGIIAVEQM